MEMLMPKPRLNNKNHGGGHKQLQQQQRRYHNQQHNPNYNPQQYQRNNTPRLPYSPFLARAPPIEQQKRANVSRAPKKKQPDDQELICAKCSRCYRVAKDEPPIGFNLQGAQYTHERYQSYQQQSQQQDRLPYVLPCDHTICGDCINLAYTQRAVKCPECEVCAAIDVTNKPETSFAINYYLVGRIYLMNHQTPTSTMPKLNTAECGGDPIVPRFMRAGASSLVQQPSQMSLNFIHGSRPSLQGSCGESEPNFSDAIESMSTDSSNQILKLRCSMGSCASPAAVQCIECKSIFCAACSNVLHGGEIAGLKDHRIRPVQPHLLSSCSIHSSNVLDFHCVDCAVDLCCYCLLEGGHAGHVHVRLTMLSEDQKVAFKELIVNVEEKLVKLGKAYKVAEQHISLSIYTANSATGHNKQHEQVVANVNKHFTDLIAKLLNTHHRLRQKLDAAENLSVMGLRTIQSEVAHKLATGRGLLSQGRLVLESSSDPSKGGSALLNVAMLKQELEQILDWPTCLVDARNGDDKTTAHIEFISDLSENLDKFWALKVQDADQFQLVHEERIPEGFAASSLQEIVQHRDFIDTSSQSSYSENASSAASMSKQSDFGRPPSALSVTKMPPVKHTTNIAASPIVGGRHPVTVVHINSPESIFVQLTDNLPILKQTHNDLANYVKSLSASEVAEPRIGEFYIVKQNIHWVRARCVQPSRRHDFFLAQLLETGQIIEVLKLHMRECNAQFRHIPPLAFHCRLHNLYPSGEGWSIESKKLLESILSVKSGYVSPFGSKYKSGESESCNVTMHVAEVQNGTYSVNLIASRDDTNTMLSLALLFTGLAKPVDSTNDELEFKSVADKKIFDNTKELQVNQRVRVSIIHVKDPYNIYVHLHNVLSHITELLRNMNNYYLENNRGIIYTPKIGMFVSIQYAENQSYNWYRGKIMNVLNGIGKVDVLLIDYGKIVNVDYKNLRALPQKFTVLECQAIHVRLADISPPQIGTMAPDVAPLVAPDDIWPDATMEFLREFVTQPGHHLEIVIATGRLHDDGWRMTSAAHNVALFECLPHVHYCINAQLVEAGLATSTGKLSSSDNIAWPQDTTSTSDALSSDDCHMLLKRGGGKIRRVASNVQKQQQLRGVQTTVPNASQRSIEGTPSSFTLDLMNAIQGPVEDGDDDDDDEGGECDKGRAEVDVLLVKSPDEIYIKVKSRDPDVLQIEPTLMRDLHLHYSDSAAEVHRLQNKGTWDKGANIVAYNSYTAQYHRGIIQQVLGDGIDGGYVVLCRDRAIEFKANHLSIYKLHDDFIEVPYLCKRVRLANIQPMNAKWSLLAIDIIHDMCNSGRSTDNTSGSGRNSSQKYYYRKTGAANVLDNGDITQPGILWLCKLISCGPLERSKYQYRSVNKQLLLAGVAVSDTHNNPYIARRIPPPQSSSATTARTPLSTKPIAATTTTTDQPPQQQEQRTRTLTPSYAADALRRAFADVNVDDDVSSDAMSVQGDKEDGSGGGTASESDGSSARKNKIDAGVAGKCLLDSNEEIIAQQPMTQYLPALPLAERRFKAESTYVDEAAHIYLHPEQLAPIMTTLNENVQRAVRVYNQKVLLPSTGRRAKTYKVGELCTVRFHLDRNWYRGRITHVIPYNTEDFGFEYRVQMVDYGNVEQVRACDLNKLVLSPTVPLIASRVRLHQLETKCGPWNTSILDAIHSLIVGKQLDVSLCDKTNNSTATPDAIIRIDGVNVNDYLLKEFDCLCRGNDVAIPDHESEDDDVLIIEESDTPATTPVEEKSKTVFSFDDLELMPKLDVGHKRNVKVIDILNINVVTVEMVPDNMKCLKGKYEEIFSSFNDALIEHVPLIDIRSSVNCLARFSVDGLYYRAEIMSILPTTTSTLDGPTTSTTSSVAAHVFFIDYGNREIVQRGHLRSLAPYDPLVRRLPALARMVALHRVRLPPSQSPVRAQDTLLDRMTDMLQQKEFTMEIVRNEPKLSVNLLDPETDRLVYQDLIAQGLVVYVDKDDSDDDYD